MDRLEGLYHKHEGQALTPSQITHLISYAIPFREINFYTVKSLSVLGGEISVSGLYDPNDDEDGLPPIEIELTFYKHKKVYPFTKRGLSFLRWRELCLDIVTILGHEYVHQHQHRERNFKLGKNYVSKHEDYDKRRVQEYYGHPDEIDAYSFTAAAVMAQETLRLGRPIELEDTGVYNHYLEAFGADHSIVTKLQKRSLKYYNILKGQYNEQTNRQRPRARSRQ